jgi:hypothetical protein
LIKSLPLEPFKTLLKAVEVDVLNESIALFVELKTLDVAVDKEATALFTALVEPPPPTNVLNDASALLVLLNPVDVDVLSEASLVSTYDFGVVAKTMPVI